MSGIDYHGTRTRVAINDRMMRRSGVPSNYERLFSTPERAANVILALQICPCVKDECVFCPAYDVCFEHYKGGRTVYEMTKWLSGDA